MKQKLVKPLIWVSHIKKGGFVLVSIAHPLRPTYNQFHNILRLFDVLPSFPFTTSETMGDYYL